MKLVSSDLLRAFLTERGMSHRRLARYAGCSHSFISHLTAGRSSTCTPELAERISEALEVPTVVLFAPQSTISDSESDKHVDRKQRRMSA